MIKKFLFNVNNINKNAYFWNTLAGIISAVQSIILLIVIARTIGEEAAGVFSIAWAEAHLALSIGRFGMRNYQVTDAKQVYSIDEYVSSRVVTCIAMGCVGAFFVVKGYFFDGYSLEKCGIIIGVCAIKTIDAFSDVITGWFQQNGRLDVGAKVESTYTSFGLITFFLVLVFSENLLVSICATFFVCLFVAVILYYYAVPYFGVIGIIKINKRVFSLLSKCIPLCLVSFFTIYIGNAPKYAIDSCLTEILQARYNYLFMPVFAIGLLATFVFFPIMSKLGALKKDNKIEEIQFIVYKQLIIILAITLAAIIVAFTIGTPILSWIYNENLVTYRFELCLLMVGGGLLAVTNLLNVIITTFRKQKYLIYVYLFVSIVAKIMSNYFVINYRIKGAVILYTFEMFMLVLLLGIISTSIIIKEKKLYYEK